MSFATLTQGPSFILGNCFLENTSLLDKIKRASRVYIVGNGGSYANALHIANDLLACGIKAYTHDPATLTASANDYGYEQVFARWVRIVGQPGDLLIALSGSGTSPNIIRALEAATDCGMDTHLVTHYLEGRDMQESEEDQIALGHNIMRALRDGE